jgi:cobalt/nickel transport system permease protein
MMLRERYTAADTPLHRLDARVKMAAALALSIIIVLTPERAWPAYALYAALLAGVAAAGRLRVRRLWQSAALVLPFALAALTLLFTTPGNAVAQAAGLTITDAGLARFAAITLKSWLAAQAALLLALSTPFSEVLWALARLRVPGTLVQIIGFMYRYLGTLGEEAERLLRARAARSASAPGQRAGGSLWWRAQTAGGMVGSLFLRSYERSERVYAAMLARGYTGQMLRPDASPLRLNALAQGIAPVAAAGVVLLLALAWWR